MRAAAVLVVLVVLPLAPVDVPEQCDQINFRRANPGLCDPNYPVPTFPPVGGGAGPGIIGRILGGLTGGLL